MPPHKDFTKAQAKDLTRAAELADATWSRVAPIMYGLRDRGKTDDVTIGEMKESLRVYTTMIKGIVSNLGG